MRWEAALPINMLKDIREKRYYGGCEVVDVIEQLAIDRVCALFWCRIC